MSAAMSLVPEKARGVRSLGAVRTAAPSPAQALDRGTQLSGHGHRSGLPCLRRGVEPRVQTWRPQLGCFPSRWWQQEPPHVAGGTPFLLQTVCQGVALQVGSWPPAAPAGSSVVPIGCEPGHSPRRDCGLPCEVRNMGRYLTGCRRACFVRG